MQEWIDYLMQEEGCSKEEAEIRANELYKTLREMNESLGRIITQQGRMCSCISVLEEEIRNLRI